MTRIYTIKGCQNGFASSLLGGGIHGVGVLHDLASRGWKDVHLVEKNNLGTGTSSKSTKLIHGGLRYLKRLRDYSLVKEGLHERQLLSELTPDIIQPIELYFPAFKKGGMPWWMVKAGLSLYDLLAGKDDFANHKHVPLKKVFAEMPFLEQKDIKKVYSFWDGQTDDLSLVEKVAQSALELGGSISEKTRVDKIKRDPNGWLVEVSQNGIKEKISCQYIFNATGPWANMMLEQSDLTPVFEGINVKGIHLVFEDMGLTKGLFLQSLSDQRIFFLLPWQGKTLLGTTESLHQGPPDKMMVEEEDVDYLLKKINPYLSTSFTKADILHDFAGLRWLASTKDKIGSTSRGFKLGEHTNMHGMILTLYGGKLTAYRHVAKMIGDRITKHYGEFIPSNTHDPKFWTQKTTREIPDLVKRFGGKPS